MEQEIKNRIYNSYSQYGEDSILLNLFGDEYQGVMIDVVALDGFHLSNSFLLSQLGWKCLLIEAHPYHAEVCEKNRGESICIKKAVSNIKGTCQIELNDRGSHTKVVEKKTSKSVQIECDTIDNIIEQNLGNNIEIDVISIDIDGSEKFALQGFDLNRWKPKILILEITEVPQLISEYLTKYGYHKSITIANTNTFLVRDLDLVKKIEDIKNQSESTTGKLIGKNFKTFITTNVVDINKEDHHVLVQQQKKIIKETHQK